MNLSVDDLFDEFVEEETTPKEEPSAEEPESPIETPEEKPVEKPKEESVKEPEAQAPEGNDFFGEEAETSETPSTVTEESPSVVEAKKKPVVEGKYDDSDSELTKKRSHMYYGPKGEGKTTLAFSHPGKIYCLSFDQKSIDIKQTMYGNDARIKVKDGIRYLDKSAGENWVESADKCFRYLNHLLTTDAKTFEPDWIVIDGLEILVRDICEKTMRYRNNIMVFQPFNLILWQERNMFVDQIHLLAKRVAKEGVIYTAYVDTRSIKIENGQVTESTREPKWAANVKYQVDTVIRVESKETQDGREFYAIVESSKTKGIKTGVRANITNKGIKEVMRLSE